MPSRFIGCWFDDPKCDERASVMLGYKLAISTVQNHNTQALTLSLSLCSLCSTFNGISSHDRYLHQTLYNFLIFHRDETHTLHRMRVLKSLYCSSYTTTSYIYVYILVYPRAEWMQCIHFSTMLLLMLKCVYPLALSVKVMHSLTIFSRSSCTKFFVFLSPGQNTFSASNCSVVCN